MKVNITTQYDLTKKESREGKEYIALCPYPYNIVVSKRHPALPKCDQ